MGLQNQLNDMSSDSIPILLIALIASFINNLRSSLFSLLHSLGLSSRHRRGAGFIQYPPDHAAVGSGLAGLIVLADQLTLNRLFSYRYDAARAATASDCVVCLCTLRDGDQVSKLHCRHVFHKHCFDGWLHHLNFNCPLCRSPLVHDDRVALTRRRVGRDILHWFSLRSN